MYKKILVALENSPTDIDLLSHVAELALCLSSELLLIHVAEGFVARHFNELQLNESEEMIDDRAYLEEQAKKIQNRGITVNIMLAMGDPSQEILNAAKKSHCDLIAMGSHGHRFLGDMIYGSTIHDVRHNSAVPVLIMCPK